MLLVCRVPFVVCGFEPLGYAIGSFGQSVVRSVVRSLVRSFRWRSVGIPSAFRPRSVRVPLAFRRSFRRAFRPRSAHVPLAFRWRSAHRGQETDYPPSGGMTHPSGIISNTDSSHNSNASRPTSATASSSPNTPRRPE